MIYKVFYQEDPDQTPQRESTHSLYAEAESIADLKKRITEKFNYGIEFVTEVNENDLDYEKQNNPEFKVLKDY